MADDKKRKRSSSSSSSSQEADDCFRFRSIEHELRYKTKILNRNFVQERAITLETGEYPEINEQIRTRGWETLVSYPKSGYQEIVKEFYANAYEDNNFVSYVRGHWIQFDPKTLNNFLKTRNPSACEYFRLKSEKVNTEKLLEILCKPGSKCSMSKIKNEPKRLKSTEFKPIPKVWSTFVHQTLLPYPNVSDVTVSRAQLVYAIVTGLEMDVGNLVAHHIKEIANDNTATLGYASLITQLCLDAGVEVGEDELPIKPIFPITAKFINKFAIEIEAEQPAPPPKKRKEKERESLEQRIERLEGNVGALCKLAIMILQSQQNLQNMVTSLGVQLHLDVYTMGGLSSTPLNEEEILAQVNFAAMESDSKECPAEGGPSRPPQQPREPDEPEED